LTPERDMTFVSDTVAGFMAAALTPGIEGMTINLGTGETHTVGWFAQRLLTLMNSKASIAQDQQRMRPERSEVLKLVSDNTLAREAMNWTPRVTLDEGLRHTIEFVRDHRDLFRTDGYVR
jgi:dTDP-glucose 4,6-dehydratase